MNKKQFFLFTAVWGLIAAYSQTATSLYEVSLSGHSDLVSLRQAEKARLHDGANLPLSIPTPEPARTQRDHLVVDEGGYISQLIKPLAFMVEPSSMTDSPQTIENTLHPCPEGNDHLQCRQFCSITHEVAELILEQDLNIKLLIEITDDNVQLLLVGLDGTIKHIVLSSEEKRFLNDLFENTSPEQCFSETRKKVVFVKPEKDDLKKTGSLYGVALDGSEAYFDIPGYGSICLRSGNGALYSESTNYLCASTKGKAVIPVLQYSNEDTPSSPSPKPSILQSKNQPTSTLYAKLIFTTSILPSASVPVVYQASQLTTPPIVYQTPKPLAKKATDHSETSKHEESVRQFKEDLKIKQPELYDRVVKAEELFNILQKLDDQPARQDAVKKWVASITSAIIKKDPIEIQRLCTQWDEKYSAIYTLLTAQQNP